MYVYTVYILQTLHEPTEDDRTLDSQFGGHRVLALMKPPTELHTDTTVSVSFNTAITWQ